MRADCDRVAGRRRGAGVVSIGAASASILAEAGAHIDCERFVRPSVAMVATVLTEFQTLPLSASPRTCCIPAYGISAHLKLGIQYSESRARSVTFLVIICAKLSHNQLTLLGAEFGGRGILLKYFEI